MVVSAYSLISLRGISALKTPTIVPLAGLLAAGTVVLLLGVYDDLRGADAKLKFGVQTCAAILLYWSGYGVHHLDLIFSSSILHTAVGLPLTVFWVLLITNAFNLIDGLDGLAAGSAFFSTIVMFVVSLLRHSFVVSFITVALAGAILGFLRYNFNPATIFLGDSGSLFIGFVLSAVALAGSQKATTIIAVTIPVIAFGLPILDVALAVFRRFFGGKPLFTGDNDHIHHKLLKRGLSQRGAVLTLYVVTAAFGLLSLALLHREKMLATVLVVIAIGVFWGIRELRYVEFFELHGVLQRAVARRRIITNNVNVRQAAESLQACKDREGLCKILQETFEPLGFDGFRLEDFSGAGLPESFVSPLCRDSKGRLQYKWSGVSGLEPSWELRLQLPTNGCPPFGYLCLFQMKEDKPLLFDLGVITNGVRTSISNAIQRTIPHADVNADRARAAGQQ
jgi:UDP-GlcNAc:undecaprenyl-phosphate GlcNAc-1-phosphate transferase